jgi:MoaA/NifB/PqqE/SkfB family radical SAM enzyme
MAAIEILADFLKGRHTLGQMVNLAKYSFSKKKSVVNWDPIDISIFITVRCNLSCDMCLTHSTKFSNPWGQKPTKDVDFELFKQILARYKNALTVNLIGNGEPLLHKDLFKMIEYASTMMKMNVNSSSNGIVVGQYLEEIVNSPLKHFNISINGHNREEFNRMTGMPSELFNVICNNTVELMKRKRAKGSRLKIAATFILDQGNYRCLEDMIYFADSLEVDQIVFFQFLPSPVEGFTAEERCLFADDAEVIATLAKVNSLPPRIREKVTLPVLLDRTIDNNKYCTVWLYNISIDGDRNVGGCCCQLLDLSVSGKLDEGYPWNNAYFQEMRRRFIDPMYPLLEPCTWCYNNSSYIRDWSMISNPISRLARRLSHLLQK